MLKVRHWSGEYRFPPAGVVLSPFYVNGKNLVVIANNFEYNPAA